MSMLPLAACIWEIKKETEKIKDELELRKQIPMHPRDRLKRQVKEIKDELEFTKQVLMHPRHRLKRVVKKEKN